MEGLHTSSDLQRYLVTLVDSTLSRFAASPLVLSRFVPLSRSRGLAPPDPIAVRLPGGRTAGQALLCSRSACPEG